ncbi:hypothetical protein [Paeniglutamicibacter kerguelensis]|uniref:Subtilisin family serine protease n=1 Tax=Paeniglutamicibacter kerguelensis TaxID=254788 RepID=A0ABS4XHQ0_9MICC|nr:hypothetical protein [Paeniglutamicibacter kerguelensis]MBP2388002.1 subtilisin family serine protease [Paeniglutamicibacter kerguelensis]
MRKSTKLFTSLAMTVALGASLAACSSTPEENTAAACDSYAAFVGAVAEVKTSLNSGSNIGAIQAARDKVKAAYSDLEKSLEKVGEDRRDAFETAWDDLDKAVSDVDPDMTVPEAKASLSDNIAQVETAQKNLNDELGC